MRVPMLTFSGDAVADKLNRNFADLAKTSEIVGDTFLAVNQSPGSPTRIRLRIDEVVARVPKQEAADYRPFPAIITAVDSEVDGTIPSVTAIAVDDYAHPGDDSSQVSGASGITVYLQALAYSTSSYASHGANDADWFPYPTVGTVIIVQPMRPDTGSSTARYVDLTPRIRILENTTAPTPTYRNVQLFGSAVGVNTAGL